MDSLFNIESTSGQERVDRWTEVKRQLSIVTYFIHSTVAILNDFDDFWKQKKLLRIYEKDLINFSYQVLLVVGETFSVDQ